MRDLKQYQSNAYHLPFAQSFRNDETESGRRRERMRLRAIQARESTH
jgi:hypothetical protein